MTAAIVLVVGSYNRDTVVNVPRWPAAGETVAGGRIGFAHGGKGSNQALQATRCGARVVMLAAVGNDPAGDAALALWRSEGIDTAGVQRLPGQRTGGALVMVDADGGNRIVLDAGANAALQPPLSGLAGSASVVVAQLEVPAAVTAAVLSAARAAGALTILNAAPMDREAVRVLAPHCELLVVNEGEASALLGGIVDAATCCTCLLARGLARHAVVVTAGAQGAFAAESGRPPWHVPARPVHVIDTTAAGDAFVGALAARLAEGASLAQALPFAAAAGALACTQAGAEPSLHARAAIEALA